MQAHCCELIRSTRTLEARNHLLPVYWNEVMLVYYNIPSTPILDRLFLYWYKEYADVHPTSNFFFYQHSSFLSTQFIS